MAEGEPQLKLDKNPSPKDEARDFENPDERLLAKNHAHELAVLKAKLGLMGRITGSTNESMNTGLFIFVCCCILLFLSALAGLCKPEAFSPITDSLLKILPAIIGYVIGTKVSQKD